MPQQAQSKSDTVSGPQSGWKMELWNKVCSTPPKHTKEANNGRFKFTCIDPQFQTKQATEIWGPYGGAWGLRNFRWEKIEVLETVNIFLCAEFYYPDGQFDVLVDMKYRPGFDTAKCLVTSAKSKALSMLGFGADVFMGMYDDVHYVQMQQVKQKDSEALRKTMLARVRLAEDPAKLDEQESKISEMIADDIVSASVGGEVLAAIEKRRGELK